MPLKEFLECLNYDVVVHLEPSRYAKDFRVIDGHAEVVLDEWETWLERNDVYVENAYIYSNRLCVMYTNRKAIE